MKLAIYMKKTGLFTALAVVTITAHAQHLELNTDSQLNQKIPTLQFSVDATAAASTLGSNLSSAYFTPVPEPTQYLMFGLGALVLAFGRWRAYRSRGPRL
jgi:hypothetical protein